MRFGYFRAKGGKFLDLLICWILECPKRCNTVAEMIIFG